MQMMKQRAKTEVTPIPTIYEEELIKLRTPESNDDTRQIIEQLPTYYSCKTALYHQRSLNIPGLPKTTTDINLHDKWCLTTAGDQFLLPSVYPPMLILSTINNLTNLAAANTIFCDGLFCACPCLLHQFYTVHAMVDGSMYPLVFVLLPGKTRSYTHTSSARSNTSLNNTSYNSNQTQYSSTTRQQPTTQHALSSLELL